MGDFLQGIRAVLRNLMRFSLKNRWVILAIDLVLVALGFYFSVLFHNRYQINDIIINDAILLATIYIVFAYLSFFVLQTYRGLIRHLQFQEMGKLGLSIFIPAIAIYLFSLFSDLSLHYPFFFATNVVLLNFILLIFFRYALIYLYSFASSYNGRKKENTLIFGIGAHSVAIMQWFSKSGKQNYNVQGFVTRNSGAKKTQIQNLPVYNLSYDNVYKEMFRKEISVLIFPDYKAVRDEQEFLTACIEKGIKVMVTPPFEGVDSNGKLHFQMKPIQFEDLLGREEIRINLDLIAEQIQNKVVMITGAAGSIGSELVRQLAMFKPELIVLFDIAETPLHQLRLELETKYPHIKFVPVIGDVRNISRLDWTFNKFRPSVLYHAAAYKHVPLMEQNPCEAILCNVLGTRNLADKAVEYGVERFVMVSTDKAVNPTNIMGASKRVAEIYVQSLAGIKAEVGKTVFVTTRFGNVLGSNGSVIPHFKSQIENGGPVTVTHPDIIRYFMTIPEACRLVLEAGSFGKSGQIYIFDMGKPVKIVDLARKMIEMAGLQPDKDIKINFVGLREGEKLFEELLNSKENTLPTNHDKIMIAGVATYKYEDVCMEIDRMLSYAGDINIDETVMSMKRLVPEFKSKNSPFEIFDKC